MNPFMLISVLMTAYLCVVEGQLPCTTPSGGAGKCISLYDCSELYTIVKNPNRSQTDIDNLKQFSCGFEGKTPKVCCPVAETNRSCLTPNLQQGECISLHSCEHLMNYLNSPISRETIILIHNLRCEGDHPVSVCCSRPPNLKPEPNSDCNSATAPLDPASGCCGQGKLDGDRIIGGNVTDVDDYPWLALIEYSRNNKIMLLCGGTLISNRYVLTAGHCVAGAVLQFGTPRSVRLGEYDTSNNISEEDCATVSGGGVDCTEGAISIPIEKIIPHPNYKSKTKKNDIALLRMAKPAPYSDFVRPICLPTSDMTLSPPSNWHLIASGWGVNETVPSNLKLDVDLPFVPRSVSAF
ncbi:phenoloxidase-activating enzyme-like isoform X2 [Hyposmocoma kahamanoa]|uniref:phenoloxidase-activating enzyme-like isoform X2 n=1 Tax=Hyposmocoma kahamanoa TaxID=1477025 RepID=UPI000E6D777F|nr:phenoloxidase-activating enzyme-like isoform X2 [Hyposmocoma kahamanoa]